ncbi:MAG: hypothetical protein AAFV53_29655 [Myxococcota bacterium]
MRHLWALGLMWMVGCADTSEREICEQEHLAGCDCGDELEEDCAEDGQEAFLDRECNDFSTESASYADEAECWLEIVRDSCDYERATEECDYPG